MLNKENLLINILDKLVWWDIYVERKSSNSAAHGYYEGDYGKIIDQSTSAPELKYLYRAANYSLYSSLFGTFYRMDTNMIAEVKETPTYLTYWFFRSEDDSTIVRVYYKS